MVVIEDIREEASNRISEGSQTWFSFIRSIVVLQQSHTNCLIKCACTVQYKDVTCMSRDIWMFIELRTDGFCTDWFRRRRRRKQTNIIGVFDSKLLRRRCRNLSMTIDNESKDSNASAVDESPAASRQRYSQTRALIAVSFLSNLSQFFFQYCKLKVRVSCSLFLALNACNWLCAFGLNIGVV